MFMRGQGGGGGMVQRFDHGSYRIWVLGAPGTCSGSSEGEGPLLSLLLSMQREKRGVRTALVLHPSLRRALGFCRLDIGRWLQLGFLPRVLCLSLPSMLSISFSKEPRVFLRVGGEGVFAVRPLGGGSIGTSWPSASLIIRQEPLAIWSSWKCPSRYTSGHWSLQHAHGQVNSPLSSLPEFLDCRPYVFVFVCVCACT